MPENLITGVLEQYGQAVADMRNGLHHIHQAIPNIAKRKGAAHPLYGTISFATPLEQDGSFEFVMFSFGGLQLQAQIGAIVDTGARGISDLVSNIIFSAFSVDLLLSQMLQDLQAAVIDLSARIETIELARLQDFCASNGLSYEDTVATTIHFPLVARLRFTPVEN